jgi:hypothetical protein
MAGSLTNRDGSLYRRFTDAYAALVEPRLTGLPNWRVVTWFPALVAIVGVVLIALAISGTSSGVNFTMYGTGVDPQLLWGSPKQIRGDEWLVQQGWIVSQAQQGFPIVNGTFPGGMNSTIVFELPSWDWTALLRPHMWGFLLFGLDVGAAWQWWLPGIGVIIAAYLLIVTIVPRRPLTAALMALGIFFSPMFQWWYGPNAIWPAAWAMLAMAATVWMLSDDRRWVRLVWAVVVGWLAVTMAIGLYIPFSVPSIIVFLFFFVGMVLQERPWSKAGFGLLVRRLLPLVVAGVSALVATGVFVLTRIDAFAAVGSTVYPGERSDPTGRFFVDDPTGASFLGAPFGQSFAATSPNVLGANPSESATVILLALFVTPALAWFAVSSWRRERRIDWVLVTSCLTILIFLAYMFVPGWDAASKLLLLDKVPVLRLRMGFLVLTPLFFALVVREIDKRIDRSLWREWVRNLPIAITCAVLATVLTGYTAYVVFTQDRGVLAATTLWKVTVVAILLSAALVFFRQTIPFAALAFLVASLTIGAGVNPLYRGIFNLNDTEVGQAVAETNEEDPGTWVGVGINGSMAVLVSSGVDAYSGVQPYPSEEMWEDIDPDGSDEEAWNRLGHVRWTWGSGEPETTTPVTDQILTTFDACSDFAQEHVKYVLADVEPPDTDCLQLRDEADQGASSMDIYRVVPPTG